MLDRLPVVVLTGGIATGKTQVSNRLATCGALIIDTDVIAKQITEPGQAGHQAIATHWGKQVLLDTGQQKGQLNRRVLREIIFKDSNQRKVLEGLLHPLIMAEVRAQIDNVKDSDNVPYVVVVIPLYAETPSRLKADAVVVVDAPRETQVRRLMTRDGVDEQLAEKMLNAQASRDERLALATHVVENTADLASLNRQVDELDRTLKTRFGRG